MLPGFNMRGTEARSRTMRTIKRSDTAPELRVRSVLHRRGLRFKVDDGSLSGRPDIVLPMHRCVIFVHGCFWHGHQCHHFKWPKARKTFWSAKILGNISRVRRVARELVDLGWRVVKVWECAIRDQPPAAIERRMDRLASWIRTHDSGRKREVSVSGI